MRNVVLGRVLVALLLAFQGGCNRAELGDKYLANVAYDSSEFVGSLGVNTHVGWTKTPYGNLQKVAAGARYLGIHKLRDSVDASSYPGIDQLAGEGLRFDLWSHPDLSTFVRQVDALTQAHPGLMAAIEGPNEVDGWPIAYNGLSGYPAASAFQAALYAKVKADRLLSHVPVYNITVSGLDAGKYKALGNLSGSTDYANVHVYYGGGQPSYGWSQADTTFHWKNWLTAGQI
ncbi:MAG: repeat protein, partial [Phenylobacterium sp.]|nr:repeat protein [Phenylobacterium sp.]